MTSTTFSSSLQRLPLVALAGFAYYVLIVIALHFLRPDLNPITQLTSAYTIGPFGFLMSSAFVSVSLGSLALVIGLYHGVSERARSRIGLALLGWWAVGNLIAALLPWNQAGAPQTISAAIAQLNAPLHVLSLVSGAILVSRRFKQDDNWRPFHHSALFLSLVMLVEFIGVALMLATQSGIAGLGQRIFVVTALTWLVLTATRLRSIANGAVPV